MPSSVSEGVRPRAARMRSYSSAVMLCVASICGVMLTGSGTTAAEELVIVDAFIFAQGTCRAADAFDRAAPREKARRWVIGNLLQVRQAPRMWRIGQRLCDTLEADPHPRPGWRNWQTQQTQNLPALVVMGVRPPLPAPD